MKLLFAFFIFATSVASSNTLTIEITKLESNKGKVMIQILNTDKKVVKRVAASIKDMKAVATIKDLPAGTYAVQYFHDENENGKMDTGTFGIPTEGYGFSNNARGFMGPPDFDKQLFEFPKNTNLKLVTVN